MKISDIKDEIVSWYACNNFGKEYNDELDNDEILQLQCFKSGHDLMNSSTYQQIYTSNNGHIESVPCKKCIRCGLDFNIK